MPRTAPHKRKITTGFLQKVKPQPNPIMIWDTYQRGLALRVETERPQKLEGDLSPWQPAALVQHRGRGRDPTAGGAQAGRRDHARSRAWQ